MKIHYCYSSKMWLFREEIQYAKELGLYIFYDKENDLFLDRYNNLIDIQEMKILPRTNIPEAKKLIDAIINHGGKSIITKEEYDLTLNWPYYIKTTRNNIILTGNQIIENPTLISSIFGNEQVFFKTKNKNFSSIVDVSEFFQKSSAFIRYLKEHQNDDFIISEAVKIARDKHGLLEFRAFIVNGEIYNVSRISQNLLSKIPKEILNKLKEIVSKLNISDFPKSYVIDLFIYTSKEGNRVVDILECNPIIASGTYLYNSVIEKIPDLEHNCQRASLPKEKVKNSDKKHHNNSFDSSDTTNASIFNSIDGVAVSDFTSFLLYDTKEKTKIILSRAKTKMKH